MNEHAQRALLADLRGLAGTWATFRARHGDMASPTFCNGLEECARQLVEALDRAKQLADADPFGPDAYKNHQPGCVCPDCKAAVSHA